MAQTTMHCESMRSGLSPKDYWGYCGYWGYCSDCGYWGYCGDCGYWGYSGAIAV